MQKFRSLGFPILIVFGFAAVVFAVVRWVPIGSYPEESFFDLAAQTIPILLVALAVEAQARQFDLEPAGKRIRIAAVILLALGEITAILVSASLLTPAPGVASEVFVVITAAGLLGGFLAVIFVAMRMPSVRAKAPVPVASEPRPPTIEPTVTSRDPVQAPVLLALAGVLVGALLARVGRGRLQSAE